MVDIGAGQLQLLINTLQNGVVATGAVNKTLTQLSTNLQAALPAGSVTATSATAGAASALPSPPAGYWVVQLPGVGNVKIPYYNP